MNATVGKLLAVSGLPVQEAQLLMEKAAGIERVALIARPERLLEPEQIERAQVLFARRRAGEPIAYLLGEREFWGMVLKITPDVLIPRPETELLVELALTYIAPGVPARVLDLGTGSGAVAVSLAVERPNAAVTAVDLSDAALAVARENAGHHGANVRFLQGNWFDAIDYERFDLIVGNPPYVAEADSHLEQGDLRYEPRSSLAAGPDGLAALRTIIAGASNHMTPAGVLLLEHGYDQAARVHALFAVAGFAGIKTWRDLAGIERVSGGHRGSGPA
jgi:release factor glutamine methyltransferase